MKPYRRHLIGLPLQQSVFSNIDRAPELIGLTGVLPDDRLRAWVNDDGDLFLDKNNVELLARVMAERISPQLLDTMERSLDSACQAVLCATKLCRDRAPAATATEARQLIAGIGEALRALIPFGILSKFVPDVLLRTFSSSTDAAVPRLRHDSPGLVLTRDAFALFEECVENGFTPDRLLMEWPAVPSIMAERVRTFCERHTGFGPLPWEAPGYEDPRYVFAALRASFGEGDLEETGRRLCMPPQAREETKKELPRGEPGIRLPLSSEGMLKRVIVGWLEFLERETWYVRRAFYTGIVPLLVRVATEYRRWEEDLKVEDVLFLELDELSAPRLDFALARSRRERYLTNSEYLNEYGISPGRLRMVLEAF